MRDAARRNNSAPRTDSSCPRALCAAATPSTPRAPGLRQTGLPTPLLKPAPPWEPVSPVGALLVCRSSPTSPVGAHPLCRSLLLSGSPPPRWEPTPSAGVHLSVSAHLPHGSPPPLQEPAPLWVPVSPVGALPFCGSLPRCGSLPLVGACPSWRRGAKT